MGTIWEQMLYLCHNKIIQPMKATAFIRKTASKNDTNSVATIYFRLRDGKKDIKAASELTINPNHWSSEKQGYKDRVALVSEEKKQALNNEVQNILNLINQNYTPESDSEWLSALIDKYHHPNRYKTKEEIEAENKPILLELFSEFLVKHKLSEVRKKNFRVIQRTLARYELYVRATKKGKRTLPLMLIPSHLKLFGTCGTSSRTNTSIMNCTRAFMKPFQKRELRNHVEKTL